MEITRLIGILSAFFLAGCQYSEQNHALPPKDDYPTEWNFNFFTPKALPALVTFAVVQDTDGRVYRFNTLNSTPSLYNVIGEWNDQSRAPGGHWNKVRHPPIHIFFCWDSVIDKKVYETRITFSESIIEKMSNPSNYKDYHGNTAYYDTVQIGLAPEGKVAIWLRGIGTQPNYRVTPLVIKTFSGTQLDFCKGITKHPNGYKYYGETPDFIKGKTYPYGNW